MERTATHSVRADAELYGTGEDDWPAQCGTGRGKCVRLESGRRGGAMPSRGAEEWQPGWISMGREEESGVVGKRALSSQQALISKGGLTRRLGLRPRQNSDPKSKSGSVKGLTMVRV